MLIDRQKVKGLNVMTMQDGRGNLTKTVYFEYRPIASFNPDRINDCKAATVQLIELGYCDQKSAGIICDFHRNTVAKILQTKRLLGIEAIFHDDRGPKGSWKYIDNVYDTIKNLLNLHSDWTDQQIADTATKELDISISRSAVLRIRTENDKPVFMGPSRLELEELAKFADSIDVKQHDERQLAFNFEDDPAFKAKVDEFAKEDVLKVNSNTEKNFSEELKAGQRNVFAGMLFHNVFLNKVNFSKAFDNLPCVNNTYKNYQILQSIFYGLQIGLNSIESHKLVNSRDLGLLLGKTSSPDKDTIRQRLNLMAKSSPAEDLIDHFANIFLTQNFIDPEVFFIDGHFLPYYGLQILSKGYHTVRRLAMKGNEIYVITDLDKKPLFFITENCDIDFRPIIERAAEKLVNLGIARPLLVFDRGGYGVHFFSQLQVKADFITWAKYLNKNELKDIEYTLCTECNDKKYLIGERVKTITEAVSTAKKEGRQTPSSLEVRMVVFNELNSENPLAVYTSNREKSAGDIAYYMLSRWGDSENFLKEIMALYNFNYHPGYDLNILAEQPLVDNPDVKTIKRTIKAIKQKIGQLVVDKNLAESKLNKRSDVRLDRKIAQLQSEIVELSQDLDNFNAKLNDIPEKISIIELLKGKMMSKADLEKKKLYDLLQMLAYHSREHLVKIFRSCYKDKRDVKQVLTKITKLSGYVKLHGKTLVVLLDWIESKKHRQAAINFCHRINKMRPRLSGQMEYDLYFRFSSRP